MEDKLITEHAGTRRDGISRLYQYGGGGVRVLDSRRILKRLYAFDPVSGIMTERDPGRQDTILRRFVFDTYGMLEETFAFGERPRTFRYEDGASRIAVREGGDYGAVGKIFTFEDNGIIETAWGRHGEIGHVYQYDAKDDAIVIRKGGWYGDVERTIVFAGMGASLFMEPESFLQFLMFTEWSEKDKKEDISERVAEVHGRKRDGSGTGTVSRAGTRSPPAGSAASKKSGLILRTPRQRKKMEDARTSRDDEGIDFIPDADAPAAEDAGKQKILSRQSRDITWEERRNRNKGSNLP